VGQQRCEKKETVRSSRQAGHQQPEDVKSQGLPQTKPRCLQQESSLDKHSFQSAVQTTERRTPAPMGVKRAIFAATAPQKPLKMLWAAQCAPATQATANRRNLNHKSLRQSHAAETEPLCWLWWFYQGWAFGNFLTPTQSDSNTNTVLRRDKYTRLR